MAKQGLESIKDIAADFIRETYNNHNLGLADDVLVPNFAFHNAGKEIRGRDAWKQHVEEWLTGFPDLRVTIGFTMAEGDRVLLHWQAEGTHQGEFRGTLATGRRVLASGLTLFRISSGKIEEMWDEVEAFGTLQPLTVT